MQAITDALKPTLECPERMWQGFSLEKRQVLFVDESKKEVYLWNDQRTVTRGITTTLDYGVLPERFQHVTSIDFNDYEGVSISSRSESSTFAACALAEANGCGAASFCTWHTALISGLLSTGQKRPRPPSPEEPHVALIF